MLPEFDERTGCPPPGRYRVTAEEARALLVDAPRFAGSPTRSRLWEGLERYMSRFVELEDRYTEVLGGVPLVHYIWLGGSYVSTKWDPRNIDCTVFVDDLGAAALRGRQGAPWLTKAFNRDHAMANYGLSPIRVRYRCIPSVFKPHELSAEELNYLRERGSWDDWWQRCRQPGIEKMAPTAETARPARGYLEVTL